MDLKVRMKSGTEYELTVNVNDFKPIVSALNKHKFVYFGSIAFNTAEIESVQKK